ncbi:MAG: hypothetical protein ACLTZB_04480 [Streptococcus salivarius]
MDISASYGSVKFFDEDYRLNFASISMAIMGTQKPISKEDTVYEMSVNLFSDVMSVYGRKYFGEEAKTDVTGYD